MNMHMHYIGDYVGCQNMSNEFAMWERITCRENMGFVIGDEDN